jgi:hypothetical protein
MRLHTTGGKECQDSSAKRIVQEPGGNEQHGQSFATTLEKGDGHKTARCNRHL